VGLVQELDAEFQKKREASDAPLEDDGAYADATKKVSKTISTKLPLVSVPKVQTVRRCVLLAASRQGRTRNYFLSGQFFIPASSQMFTKSSPRFP
jgi:hypothetical protein